jgi:hypothetical protein
MKLSFRISQPLLKTIHTDLSRPHFFAYERVGFISCRIGTLKEGVSLLAENYHPVIDDDYEDGHMVGAMMGSAAIRKALQFAYNNPVVMLHVHRHEHRGSPRFSKVDLDESAKFVPDFWKVRPNLPHGILVLSHDSIFGLCWNAITKTPQPITEITVVGRPIQTWRYNNEETITKAVLSRN